MPVEMAMWKMTSDGPLAIAPKKLNFEERLEELVVNDPSFDQPFDPRHWPSDPHEVRRLHRPRLVSHV